MPPARAQTTKQRLFGGFLVQMKELWIVFLRLGTTRLKFEELLGVAIHIGVRAVIDLDGLGAGCMGPV
ncbi:hypothetical protein [Sulfitobacter mediterraneus]|uniref:hypothetical protein n=1 Tax=Sulfitobacter mediterraneus TaxID=83219 RepID=UPI00046A19A0|nr:hypothetical protein [Sulfitobacter mediterraneus]